MSSPLVSNSTIQRAIDQARFFVPENQLAEKTPKIAQAIGAEKRRQAAEREALRNRLVKAAKCPTDTKPAKQRWDDRVAMMEIIRPKLDLPVSDTFGRVSSINTETKFPDHIEIAGSKCSLADYVTTGEVVPAYDRAKQQGSGKWAVIGKREWSGEYRIRTEVEQPHAMPPQQSGKRITTKLSDRGALSLADSCHYMAVKHGGYSTFLTLTFNDEARARIESEETTIQQETSRFFDAVQKMYQRGWVTWVESHRFRLGLKIKGADSIEPNWALQHTSIGPVKAHKVKMAPSKIVARTNNKCEVKGVNESLKYCWVAENPKNDAGEDNPHLHVLMSWRVDYAVFQQWAKRIEGVWGQGFAHLEKIKDPMQAGAYMAKAAGYLTKANGESDQGEIRGNRYSISADSRAPDWERVSRAEMGSMGFLIADVHDYFSHKFGHVFKERKELNTRLDEIKTEQKQVKESGGKVSKISVSEREKIGRKLAEVRKVANDLPAVAGKYQLLIKGVDRFNAFMTWATKGARNQESDWLPEIHKSEVWEPERQTDSLWYSELKKRRKVKYTRTWFGKLQAFYSDCVEQIQRTFNDEYSEYAALGVAVND